MTQRQQPSHVDLYKNQNDHRKDKSKLNAKHITSGLLTYCILFKWRFSEPHGIKNLLHIECNVGFT